jgi:hypothetical protein
MRSITAVALAAALWAAIPARALSQPLDEDHLHFAFGGGFTTPDSEVRHRLGNGYHILFGVRFDLTSVVTIEGLLSANNLGDTPVLLPVSVTPAALTVPRDFSANMSVQLATANLVIGRRSGGVRPYAAGGVGVYNRPVEITTTTLGYVSGFCDPWIYVCVGGGVVPVEEVVGRRSSTDVGVDIGGGATLGSIYFAEIRFHYIWGPTIGPPQPEAGIAPRKIDGTFVAASFGVRF